MSPGLIVPARIASVEVRVVDTRNFHDASLRRERSGENRDAALRVDRVGEWVDDLAVGLRRVERVEVLGNGVAGHGHAVAVDESGLQQLAHHNWHATDLVEVNHVVLAVRLGVGNVRHARPDSVEVVEAQIDARFVGDGQEVQHRVCRAAERHRDRDRVLECRLRHDLARPDAEFEQAHDGLTALERVFVAAHINRRR